jgi:hypothetical protein
LSEGVVDEEEREEDPVFEGLFLKDAFGNGLVTELEYVGTQ